MKNSFLIDAYNLIYRMFYAVPEMTDREGRKVNAIFWVAKFLKSLYEQGTADYLFVASDGGGKGIRSEIYPEYKGTRDRMPDDLRSQIDGVFALFSALDIPVMSRDRYEADDIIGTVASQFLQKDTSDVVDEVFWGEQELYDGSQLVIISSDKDLCQFVRDDRVHIYDAMKQKFMREADVIEKFWVPAVQVRDYLAIVWDTSDNIPGIAGFWPKKATDLLSRFSTLEGIYDHLDEVTPKLRETLLDQREKAFLSQSLATIITDLDVSLDRESGAFSTRPFWTPAVVEFFQSYGFRSLLPREYQVSQKKLDSPSQDRTSISDIHTLLDSLHCLEGARGILFSVDTEQICLSDFLSNQSISCSLYLAPEIVRDWIFSHEDQIIGYGLKEDLSRLFAVCDEQRAQKGVSDQQSLFI